MTKLRTAAVAILLLLTLGGCGRSRPSTAEPTLASPSPSSTATTPAPSPSTAPTPSATSPKPTATTAKPPFPATLRGKDIERMPTASKIVALTFDAGANADSVTAILATLDREQVKATFFLTGDFVTRYPEQARRKIGRAHV